LAAELLVLVRRNGAFRRLFLAQMLVAGAFWIVQVPMLVLLNELTGSGVWGALVLAVDTGATALLLPLTGALADRLDRRKIIVIANVVQVASVLPLFAVRSAGTAWLAVASVAVFSTATACFMPAASAALPNLVDPADLAAANAGAGAAFGTISIIAASIGGLLVAVFDPYISILLTMLALLAAVVLVWGIRQPFQSESNGQTSSLAAVREGFRFLLNAPRVRSLVTVKSAVGLGNGAFTVYPLLAVSFGIGGIGTGLLFAARGLGVLLGPLLLSRQFSTHGRWLIPSLGLSMAAFGLSNVGASVMPVFPLVLVFVLIAHVAAGSNWALSSYALQALVPDVLRGRVLAADMMLSAASVTLSQLLAGALIDRLNPRVLLASLSLLTTLYAVGWLVSARHLSPFAQDNNGTTPSA
jgi:MFS family permease